MKYGYYNPFKIDYGEKKEFVIWELEACTDKVFVEWDPSCFALDRLLSLVQAGDTVYVYDLQRSCCGLYDLADTLKIIYNKEASFISIQDKITVDHSEKGKCILKTFYLASALEDNMLSF